MRSSTPPQRRRGARARLALLLAVGLSCRDNLAAPATRSIEKAVNGGDLQSDTVLATLAPLGVLVRVGGAEAQGVPVYWTIYADAVVAGGSTSSTNAAGIATMSMTFDGHPHAYTVRAGLTPTGTEPSVIFILTARPGNAVAIHVVSGADQVDTATARLGADYVVQASDSHGNGVPGVGIDWVVTAGGGTISPTRSITASPNGYASAKYTLGPTLGLNTVTATGSQSGTHVEFHATGTVAHPTLLKIVSGNNQLGLPNQPLTANYVVQVTDRNGNGAAGMAIDWTITGGGGALSATRTTTGPDGQSSVTATLGLLGSQQTVKATANAVSAPAVTFAAIAGSLGTIQVTTRTTGVELDPNGYTASTASSFGATSGTDVPINGTATITGALPGANTVTLGGLAVNCEPVGSVSQPVMVPNGGAAAVAFDVTCAQPAQLAASRNVGDRSDIYTVTSTGTVLTRLTSEGTYNGSPVWSPDGSKIAFVSSRFNDNEIYVMNADGSGKVRVTGPGSYDSHPSWSPDGLKIAFTRSVSSPNPIIVAAVDGSAWTPLVAGPYSVSDPAWSPDGKKIAFSRGYYEGIYVMNADGSSVQQLAANGAQPAWSPDGTKVAFAQGSGCDYYYGGCYSNLFIMNADGTGATQLTFGQSDGRPAWSRDGRWIAFETSVCDANGCVSAIKAVRPDGTRLSDLATNMSGPSWRP